MSVCRCLDFRFGITGTTIGRRLDAGLNVVERLQSKGCAQGFERKEEGHSVAIRNGEECQVKEFGYSAPAGTAKADRAQAPASVGQGEADPAGLCGLDRAAADG